MTAPVFLRADVAIEPTVHRFYAWLHALAPQTAALQLANAKLPILESFARNPAVHAAALKRPEMRGGPFLDLPASAAARIGTLAAELRDEAAPALELAQAIGELGALLQAEGQGASLEALYARVPEPLRGLVELVYDPEHRADFRFLEPLVYASPHYDRGAQRLVLRELEGDARAFVLSTPRLEDERSLELALPFDSEAARALFDGRESGRPFEEWAELCGVDGERRARFERFFTDVTPRSTHVPVPAGNGGVRVRYLGHACVLLETRDVAVLIDPLLGYPSASEPPRLSFADLPPRLDYVLITHGHQDHFVLESLLPLRSRIGTLVVPRASGGWLEDPSPAHALRAAGFANVRELDELERLPIEGGEIVGLPFLGEHGDLRVRAKLAHLVRFGQRSFVCAADSANLEPKLYDLLREQVGRPELLFLGMECDGAPMSWLYGALFRTAPKRAHDQSRRLCGSNAERAWSLVERLAPERVCIYAMGQEPWCRFITSIEYTPESAPILESDRLIERCRASGVACERLYGSQTVV